MPFPLIPVLGAVGVTGLGLLIASDSKKKDEPKLSPEPTPAPTPNAGPISPAPKPTPAKPAPKYTPPVNPTKPALPAGLTGRVTASSGLNVRETPNTNSRILATLPFGSSLIITSPTKTAPTAGAPLGWYSVTTTANVSGFASAEFISVGGITPAQPAPTPVVPPVFNLPAIPSTPTPAVIPANVIPGIPSPAIPIPAPINPVVNPVSGYGTITATSGLNVRSGPNESTGVVTLLPLNSKVQITGFSAPTAAAPKGWYAVTTASGASGYASAEYIAMGALPVMPSAPTGPAQISYPTGTVNTKSGLNVRSAPNTSGKILAAVPFGAKLLISQNNTYPPTTGAPKGWYAVATSTGTKGYASVEFITLDANVSGEAKEYEDYMYMKRKSRNRKHSLRG